MIVARCVDGPLRSVYCFPGLPPDHKEPGFDEPLQRGIKRPVPRLMPWPIERAFLNQGASSGN